MTMTVLATIDNAWVLWAVLPLAAYVIGSTPFGFVIGWARGVDLRTQGSGNVGATNVGRVLGRKWGLLCFALDVAKGLVPVFVVGLFLRSGADVPGKVHQAAWLAVAFGAIAGHVFTFWLRFKGGKGVATSLGVLTGFWPYFTFAGVAAFVLWIVVVKASRYVSLASIVAAGAFPLLFVASCLIGRWPIGQLWPLLAFAGAMAGLVIGRHKSNIQRLLAGTENRIGRSGNVE